MAVRIGSNHKVVHMIVPLDFDDTWLTANGFWASPRIGRKLVPFQLEEFRVCVNAFRRFTSI